MVYKYSFYVLLALVTGYAIRRGDRDARIVALICCAATLLTHVMIRPVVQRYSGLEMGVFLVDLGTLAGFIAVALGSTRFWPLWVAGLQLTTSLSHLVKETQVLVIPRAYFVATVFWSYPILLILLIGTWRAHQRRRLDTGHWKASGGPA